MKMVEEVKNKRRRRSVDYYKNSIENKLNVLSKVELELIDRVMCRYVEREFFVHPTDVYVARLIMKKVRRFNPGDSVKIVEKLNIDAKLITESIERIG